MFQDRYFELDIVARRLIAAQQMLGRADDEQLAIDSVMKGLSQECTLEKCKTKQAPMSHLLIVDMLETDKDYKIIADTGGSDFEVCWNDKVVQLKPDEKYGHMERTWNFQLPNADMEKSSVTLKNGVLHVVFPKLAGQPPSSEKKLSITHE